MLRNKQEITVKNLYFKPNQLCNLTFTVKCHPGSRYQTKQFLLFTLKIEVCLQHDFETIYFTEVKFSVQVVSGEVTSETFKPC